MTNGTAFYEWLIEKHAMGERSARDVRSRCVRVEKLLGITLEKSLPKQLAQVIDRITAELPGHLAKGSRIDFVSSQLRRAVRLYAEFLTAK